MNRLPRLTLASTLVSGTLCVAVALTTAVRGQQTEADKAASAPAENQPADAGPKREKIELRRNQASGAQALVTLEKARTAMLEYKSVAADIVESITLGPRRFRVKGKYLQGTNLQLRLEYEVTVGKTSGTLIEVCDGDILWTWEKVGSDERVTRRKVREILAAAAASGRTPENLLHAELGLGGLPSLIASIQKSVRFDRQWEQDVDKHEFVVLDGTWKPEYRQKLETDGQLPPYVPDRVRIYFQKDKLFPRRIAYLKRDPNTQAHQPMVTLDFINVVWNGKVDEKKFSFTPPKGVKREDITELYIDQFTTPDEDEKGSQTTTEK